MTMKVVGRSGQVMDLPEMLAKSLLRDNTVKPASGVPKPPLEEEPEAVEEETKPKPRRPRKSKTEE